MYRIDLKNIEVNKKILIAYKKNNQDIINYDVAEKINDYQFLINNKIENINVLGFKIIEDFKYIKRIPEIEIKNIYEIKKLERFMNIFLKVQTLPDNFLINKSRKRRIVDLKKIFIYLSFKHLNVTKLNISIFLCLNHSTVLHHYNLILNKSYKFLIEESEVIYKNIKAYL